MPMATLQPAANARTSSPMTVGQPASPATSAATAEPNAMPMAPPSPDSAPASIIRRKIRLWFARKMLSDGVGIITQQHYLARIGPIFSVARFDDAAQPRYAQPHPHRIARILARHMHMGALRANLLDQRQRSGFDLGLRQLAAIRPHQHAGDERDRKHSHELADLAHQHCAQRLHLGETSLLG